MSARDVLRVAPLCAAGFLAFGYNNVLMAVLPSYLTAAGMTLGEAGVQNGVFLILAVGLRFALGSVADRRGPRWAMLVGMASFAVGALMLALPLHFGTVLAARCVQAVGLALFWPAGGRRSPPGCPRRSSGKSHERQRKMSKVYPFCNETGEGTITAYEVFPGVSLACNDFHMRYYDSSFRPDRELLCIDHCREGRIPAH